ncbi:hypothetical protein D3C75_1253760 [compost metagenome]
MLEDILHERLQDQLDDRNLQHLRVHIIIDFECVRIFNPLDLQIHPDLLQLVLQRDIHLSFI